MTIGKEDEIVWYLPDSVVLTSIEGELPGTNRRRKRKIGWIDNMKLWIDGGLEVAREIDNIKHWTDGGLEVAREIDNMKHWTDGGLEVAREIGRHQLTEALVAQ